MNSTGEIILRAEGVEMEYGVGREHLRILRGLDLELQRGETLSISGVSGSGKTTLLHILGALEQPTGGSVALDGIDIYRCPERRRALIRSNRIGYVFQSYHLLPELDLLENVVLPAMARPGWMLQARAARERARELLAKVGLAERASHRPTELSGGEQQRAAIARALINEPEIIFADEPTGNLDEHSSGLVLEQLMGLAGELRRTLVMVTHDRAVARLCERRLMLHEGRLTPL
jgi:ABC-type lipoprotein export system ATPase subunit